MFWKESVQGGFFHAVSTLSQNGFLRLPGPQDHRTAGRGLGVASGLGGVALPRAHPAPAVLMGAEAGRWAPGTQAPDTQGDPQAPWELMRQTFCLLLPGSHRGTRWARSVPGAALHVLTGPLGVWDRAHALSEAPRANR